MKLEREDYIDPACPLCGKPGETESARPVPVDRIQGKLREYEDASDWEGAERHLKYWLAEAEMNRDRRGQLMLHNELMGFYRKQGSREEALRERLDRTMESYRRCAQLLAGRKGLLRRSYLFNLLQRASMIAVTMFTYLAMGGRGRLAGSIFAMQSYVVIGSNCVPIPGAMGVADYLMLDGFENFLPADLVVSMELLSRSLSFYICVLLCGMFVFFMSVRKRKEALH